MLMDNTERAELVVDPFTARKSAQIQFKPKKESMKLKQKYTVHFVFDGRTIGNYTLDSVLQQLLISSAIWTRKEYKCIWMRNVCLFGINCKINPSTWTTLYQ